MPADFSDKLEIIQQNDEKLKSLSKSQAVYYIIAKLAEPLEKDNSDSKKFS